VCFSGLFPVLWPFRSAFFAGRFGLFAICKNESEKSMTMDEKDPMLIEGTSIWNENDGKGIEVAPPRPRVPPAIRT